MPDAEHVICKEEPTARLALLRLCGAIVNVTLPKDLDKAINWVMPETATKSWRDPEINGQRLLVQYYNY
ncbi:hypothetical protein [Pantoea vagans]|jgi:hypothetical protein|uniref:hypothetical protein n=1 Tax=Pantoea vagans TaxID=470934 RepID=UPI0028AF099B|nr:hypothetical protein [Pantoea vagans]